MPASHALAWTSPGWTTGTEESAIRRWGIALVFLVLATWTASTVIGFAQGLTIITIAAFAIAVLGVFKPEAGLIGIGLLCCLDAPIRVYLANEGLLRWNSFNYWLALVTIFNLKWLLRIRTLPVLLLYVLIALFTVQIFYSQDPSRGVQHVFGIFSCVGVLIYFMRAGSNPQVWTWLGLVCGVLGASGGLVFLLQLNQWGGFGADLEGVNLAINANAWAHFPLAALFSICLAVPFARASRSSLRWLLWLAVVNAGWVYLSGSRGTSVCAFAALGYLWIRVRGTTGWRTLAWGAALLAVVVWFQFAAMQERSLERFVKLFNMEDTIGERTSGRSDLLQGGWTLFAQHPLTGVGSGGFAPEYEKLSANEDIYFGGMQMEAHSAWIKVLAESGIFGFLLFAAFVASFAVTGWLNRHTGALPIGLLGSLVLTVVFVSTEFQSKGVWFLAAGAMLILSRAAEPATAPDRVFAPGSPAPMWTQRAGV